MRVALQGMRGSHAEAAARVLAPGSEPLFCLSANEALEALERGDAEAAVLAVSNTVDTRIEETQLALQRHGGLVAGGEARVPVSYSLFARAGREAEPPARVLLTDSSRRQCGERLASLVTGAFWEPVLNGTEALRLLGAGVLDDADTLVVAPTGMEGTVPGTSVVASAIQDVPDNATAYVLYRRG